jgi:hypothetical protein
MESSFYQYEKGKVGSNDFYSNGSFQNGKNGALPRE